MSRHALTLTTVLVAAATTGTWAFQKSLEPYNQPGHPAPSNVWVQNHGPEEAIPTTLIGHSLVGLETGTVVGTHAASQSWAYRTITIRGEVSEGLLQAGDEGWEAVGVLSTSSQGTVVLLKRPK